MLRAVFQVEQDRLRIQGTAMEGPSYLLALAIGALLSAIVMALVWKLGGWSWHLAPELAITCAVLGLTLLVVAGKLWPSGLVVMDRGARQLVVDRGKTTGQRVPLEKVRFEICEIKRWTNISHKPSWAFVARIPGEPELQLYLSVDRENVQKLWREMGEWLAGGND
jgi:MFS family permease